MRLLIDTHIFICLINDKNKIDKKIIYEIQNPDNLICISIASLWEIIIKINLGKLIVTRDLNEMYDLIENFRISILNIQKVHLDEYLVLPLIHRDPFDRLIIAQALAENLTLITDDHHIRNYPNLICFNT